MLCGGAVAVCCLHKYIKIFTNHEFHSLPSILYIASTESVDLRIGFAYLAICIFVVLRSAEVCATITPVDE